MSAFVCQSGIVLHKLGHRFASDTDTEVLVHLINNQYDGVLEDAVRRIRRHSEVPVCVGFGISTPEHARMVGSFADGVVVGSAVVDRIEAAASREAAVDAVAQFISALKAPLRAATTPDKSGV